MATKTFSADVEQLIQLVTHSVYSDKDVFLRELVSNANDAIQKAKLKSAQDPDYLGDDTDFHIYIDINDDDTITIKDNGIGMTKEEVQENIGTIASSGTAKFLKQLQEAQKKTDKESTSLSSDLIGQFGIGFYSAFMVANKIELETKSAEHDKATKRSSDGKGSYELTSSSKTTRGTEITLHLNDDSKDFANVQRLKSLIKNHSNYVPVPIMMEKGEEENKEEKGSKEVKKGEKGKDKSGNSKTGKKEYEQVNAMKSLRTKRKANVKKEEYKEFYQNNYFDQSDPLDTIHVHTEGVLSYKTLLFIPQKQDAMLMMQGGDNREEYGPDLYVQNVLISQKNKDLLPVRLRFVKGVVESNDLSLNMSRELLQDSPIITKLEQSLTKEVLKSLAWQKKKHPDQYMEFHTNYGRILKEGIHFDPVNKDKIADLVYFYSMKQEKMITLQEYIENKGGKADPDGSGRRIRSESGKEGGEKKEEGETKGTIYYLVGTSVEELQHSPYLHRFKEHDTDVLLMTDPVDEYVITALREYNNHEFKLASDQDISLGDEKESKQQQKENEKAQQKHKNFIAYLKSTLGKETVEEINFSQNLGNTPALVNTKEGQPSAQMKKIMKAMGNQMPEEKKHLTLNLTHPLTKKMMDLYNQDPKSKELEQMALYTYEQAVILEGGEVKDLSKFIERVNQMMG